jgi:hypothetical protein
MWKKIGIKTPSEDANSERGGQKKQHKKYKRILPLSENA